MRRWWRFLDDRGGVAVPLLRMVKVLDWPVTIELRLKQQKNRGA